MRYPPKTTVLLLVAALASAQSLSARAEELTLDRVFDPGRMLEIAIELPAEDWNALREQTRDVGRAFSGVTENPFTNFKGKLTIDGLTIDSVGIRKKGFLGSLDNRWPSLKVKFDEYVAQTPIRGLDTLTLNNNKQDASLASQFLAYQLFNKAGIQAPRCSFARVTVNGDYLGVYSNIESIGKPYLQRRFGNNAGNLYEGTLGDFHPRGIDRLEIKTNKQNHDLTKVNRLATLLQSKEAPPVDEIEQLIDMESFLRFWALESLIGFWDGYTNNQNNFWVYESRANGKLYFMPWGADMAFNPPAGFFGLGPQTPVSVYAESQLANRLYRDAKLAERYRETMRGLLKDVWKEEELLQTVDQIEALVTPDLRDRQASAPRAMHAVRKFIRTRRAAVEKELDNWPVKVASQPRKPLYRVDVGSAKGSFTTKWASAAPANVAESGGVKVTLHMQEKPTAVKRAGISIHGAGVRGLPFGLGSLVPPGQPAGSLVLSIVRETDDKPLTLTFPVDPKVLTGHIGKPLKLQGAYSTGDNAPPPFMPFGGPTASGNLTLSKASFNPDDPIEGEFDFTLTETHGGFMDRRGRE